MNGNIPHVLQQSADLVKVWGNTELQDGKTLLEHLTIGGISFWDVLAVDLAVYLVPQALSLGLQKPSYAHRMRPYFGWGKQRLRKWRWYGQYTPQDPIWQPGKTILFLGFNGYFYRDILAPVVAQFAKYDDIHTVSIYDDRSNQATALFQHQGLQSIWAYWNQDVKRQTDSLRIELKKIWKYLKRIHALEPIFQVDGRPLWPQIKHTVQWLFNVYLPFLLPQAGIAQHILNKYRPALIITPDVADPRTRFYHLQGRRLDIPSMDVQFGACGPEGVEFQFFLADYLAVWGKQAQDVFLAHGIPNQKIKITGSPRHDPLADIAPEDVNTTRNQIGVSSRTIMVLFASTYNSKSYNKIADPEVVNKIKRAVFQATHQTDGLCLVVKPHPLEDVNETKKMAGDLTRIKFIDQRSDIRDLIKACDVFVSMGTAATLDALILNKLVICPIFPGWAWGDLFVKDGATLTPHSYDDVLDCFQKVVKGHIAPLLKDLQPARENFLSYWVHQADGQAAARIEKKAINFIR